MEEKLKLIIRKLNRLEERVQRDMCDYWKMKKDIVEEVAALREEWKRLKK